MTDAEFRDAFHVLSQAMTFPYNKEVAVPMNLNLGTEASRVRDFTRMNTSEYHGSKIE